ncbi:hypothetical protein M8C21_017668, partial [Ambrosia artemisiifolia]
LEVLKFADMPNWKEWSTSDGENHGTFPCLREISIVGCAKLDVVAIDSIQSLLVLHVSSELTYLWESEAAACEIMKSLQKLEISYCKELVSLGEKEAHLGISMESVTEVRITSCQRLKSYMCPDRIEKLTINNGYGFLPSLCLKALNICYCKNLNSFPYDQLQNLTSLEDMWISNCPSLDFLFPSGLWPPNLRFLKIGGLKKDISEWGLQNFPTSLVELDLDGENSDGVVSFAAKAEEDKSGSSSSSFILPSSLTRLDLWNFTELESVSQGLQHITCLQHLYISRCLKVVLKISKPDAVNSDSSSAEPKLLLTWVINTSCARCGYRPSREHHHSTVARCGEWITPLFSASSSLWLNYIYFVFSSVGAKCGSRTDWHGGLDESRGRGWPVVIVSALKKIGITAAFALQLPPELQQQRWLTASVLTSAAPVVVAAPVQTTAATLSNLLSMQFCLLLTLDHSKIEQEVGAYQQLGTRISA